MRVYTSPQICYNNAEPFDETAERMSGMNETELKDQVIKEFVNLQRIKTAPNKEAEIEYQETILKVRMQTLGIPTEDLEIKP
ncbi:hypothetical protein D1646_12905 [Pseudoflavonifractor sp. 60]|nr:hypothetical protein [Pseudoflavonifractor sp. 60]